MEFKTRMNLSKRASAIALSVNISLMTAKIAAGLISGSTAIIADAFNNATDIFATIAVFGGIRISYLPPDEKHQYGHAKAEPIVAKLVAILIIFTAITIGYTSIKQLFSIKTESPGFVAIMVSFFSILIKYALFKYTNRVGNLVESPSMIADSYNHRSDVLASSAVLLGVVGARFGYPILDPAAGLVVSILILKTGVSIYINAINDLMDTAPDPKTINFIKKVASKTNGVIHVNNIRARKYGSKYQVDLKICVDGHITVEEGHLIAANTKHNIMKEINNVEDIMVHVNPCSPDSRSENSRCINCSAVKK